MLIKRIFSSSALIGIVVVSLFFEPLYGLMVTVLTAFGLYEFFTMVEKKGIWIYKYFGIMVGVLIPLSILFRFELTKNWELFFIALALIILIIMQFRRRQNIGVIVGISVTVFGVLYVAWFFSFMIKLRLLDGGLGLIAAVLLITKLNDIGAFLVGSRFGKVPLIPRISPNKSVEGAAGGVLFSVLGGLISKPFLNCSYERIIFISIVLGILAQLGDLSESLMKRDCQVKDSGSIFPGLGGVLDCIDSLLFTAPVFYFYMSIILRK
jgi:phosphatidate cytidylyltransferase